MFAFLQRFFSPPVFEDDEEKNRSAALLSPILLGTILLLSIFFIIRLIANIHAITTSTTIFLGFLILLSAALLFILRRGYTRLAAFIFVSVGWTALTVQATLISGLRDSAVIGYVVIVIASGLLIGLRASIGYTALSLIACWAFAFLESIGRYSGLGDTPYQTALELTVIFVLVTIVSYLAVNNLDKSLKQTRANERELRNKNQELNLLHADLEKRVVDRTRDLERRSVEIQTAAQIARDASSAQNIDILLNRSVQLIRSKFGYYHIGIFQIDANNEFAILSAAGSEAGKLMLTNKYKVDLKARGIVSLVARIGEPHIILDVASNPDYIQNPLLPYTRSEMVIPLKVERRIIGVMDVQSEKENAFDQNSVSIMQIITDQISVAVERINLLQGLQQNTVALEQALQENTSRTWRTFLQQLHKLIGYKYDGVSIEALSEMSSDGRDSMFQLEPAVVTKTVDGKPEKYLAVPIRLRGLTLGAINIKFQGKDIPQETMLLIGEASNRLALALENARLVGDAQRLAKRERQINTISAQIQQSTDLNVVLQNTVRELGNTLGVPNSFIQIGLISPDLKPDNGNQH
jgi:GAF domain-containing protein